MQLQSYTEAKLNKTILTQDYPDNKVFFNMRAQLTLDAI